MVPLAPSNKIVSDHYRQGQFDKDILTAGLTAGWMVKTKWHLKGTSVSFIFFDSQLLQGNAQTMPLRYSDGLLTTQYTVI